MGLLTGSIAFTGVYTSGGEDATAISEEFISCKYIQFENDGGYFFAWDETNDTVRAYLSSGTPTLSGETAHTHAVALDGGATGAGSSHTHAFGTLADAASSAGSSHTHGVSGATIGNENAHTHSVTLDGGNTGAEAAHTHSATLDGGTTGAEAAHTHAVALDGGTTAAEAAHTHAVALDGGVTAAGASHNHAFTGTAISTDTFTVAHDATPETSVVYFNSLDGVTGWLSSDNSADSATDYFETAGGERVMVIDDSAGATVALAQKVQVYFDEDASPVDSRLMINNTLMGKDVFVRTSGGKLIRIVHNAGAAGVGVALYFNDDGGDATTRLNGTLPGTTNITTNETDDTFYSFDRISAGSNAAEATHTHGPGSLVDAASAAGSSHTHGPGTLADAASAAGSSHDHAHGGMTVSATSAGSSHQHAHGGMTDAATSAGSTHTHSIAGTTIDAEAAHTHAVALDGGATGAEAAHTHGYGTLSETATAGGSSHTHTATGEVADEVAVGTNLTALTQVKFIAIGLL
jgi:hypothetical protein